MAGLAALRICTRVSLPVVGAWEGQEILGGEHKQAPGGCRIPRS